MKLFYQMIENIVIYLVLVTIVMNLIGNDTYKKYINIFTGMILILLVMKPILSLVEWDEKLNFNLLAQESLLSNVEMKQEMSLAEGEQQNKILDEYKKQLENQIKQVVEKEQTSLVSCNITISEEEETFGTIKGLVLECSILKPNLNETEMETQKENKILIQKIEKIKIKEEFQETQTGAPIEDIPTMTEDKALFLQQEGVIKKEVNQLYGIEQNDITIIWEKGGA